MGAMVRILSNMLVDACDFAALLGLVLSGDHAEKEPRPEDIRRDLDGD